MKRLTTLLLAGMAAMACLLCTAGTAAAQNAQEAQPATSLETLRSAVKLKAGERIEITDTTGKKTTVRFAGITGSRLTVKNGKITLELKEAEIAQIRHRKPEGWWDGMLLGLAGGAAGGFATTSSICEHDPECAANAGALIVPLFAGGGAAVGAVIDSLHHKDETVFDRSSSSALRRLYVSPDVGKDRKGVRVAFRF